MAVFLGLIAVIAVLGLILLASMNSHNKQQDQAQESAQSRSENETQRDEANITIRQIWSRTKRDPVAFFTLILSIFTGLLVAVAALQIWLLLRAESVAVESAKAAKQSADHAKQAYMIGERGYLGAGNWQINQSKDGNAVVSFVFKNVGKSPIHFISAKYELTLSDDLPERFEQDGVLPIPGMLTSNQEQLEVLPIRISAKDLNTINAGTKFVYIRIEVSFRDIFSGIYGQLVTARYGRSPDRFGESGLGFSFPERPLIDGEQFKSATDFNCLRRYNYAWKIADAGIPVGDAKTKCK